jgi:hypothetical protein
MHDTGSGKVRIMLDFLYFIFGMENRDMTEAVRVALFLDRPI